MNGSPALPSLVVALLRAHRSAHRKPDARRRSRATLSGKSPLPASSPSPPSHESAAPRGIPRHRSIPPASSIDHWTVTAVLAAHHSRPYYFESFTASGYGVKGNLLQATLNYARVSEKGSLLVRAGE